MECQVLQSVVSTELRTHRHLGGRRRRGRYRFGAGGSKALQFWRSVLTEMGNKYITRPALHKGGFNSSHFIDNDETSIFL